MSILDHTDPQSGEDADLPVSFPRTFSGGPRLRPIRLRELHARTGVLHRSGTSSRPRPVTFFRVIPARWRLINIIVIPLISR